MGVPRTVLGWSLALALIAPVVLMPASADAAPKRPPSSGNATIDSVDGPGRLTVRTKAGRLKLKLYLIDGPEPGECGADDATAALTRLTSGSRARVRYVTWSRKPDAEGRLPAFVGPRRADLIERSLARDLVKAEWARPALPIVISEGDGISLRVASEALTPRTLAGVWAKCGGHFHLPATEATPAHAPAQWTINADGVTEAVGPITLPTTLARGSTLTVADVERHARIEEADRSDGACLVRVPSLELVVWASTPASSASCRSGEVFAIFSSGPGTATATNGLRVGQPATAAAPLFPRLAATLDPDGTPRQLPLAGFLPVPWAWQTKAGISSTGKIVGFLTSTAPWVD